MGVPRGPSPSCATLLAMRVVIADDHRLVLDGIKRALESDDDFEIVGETQSGTQVLPLVGREKPDLVLLDVRMPHMDGLACLDEIKRRHPDVKVVMLSASTSADLVEAALKRGASAYVVKTVNPDDLPATLRQALEGNVHTAMGMDEERIRSEVARPHRARADHPRRPRARALERRDREGVLGRAADGQVPPDEHLPQARRQEPHRGDPPRVPTRPGREPHLLGRVDRLLQRRRDAGVRRQTAAGVRLQPDPGLRLSCATDAGAQDVNRGLAEARPRHHEPPS